MRAVKIMRFREGLKLVRIGGLRTRSHGPRGLDIPPIPPRGRLTEDAFDNGDLRQQQVRLLQGLPNGIPPLHLVSGHGRILDCIPHGRSKGFLVLGIYKAHGIAQSPLKRLTSGRCVSTFLRRFLH